MDKEQKTKITNFLNDQISQAEFRARAYVFDDNNKKRPTRNIYVKLNKYLEDFLNGDSAARWVTLTGLRGSGKTTIISQLYWNTRTVDAYRLYISLDYVVQILGITLNDLLAVYEEMIGSFFEKTEKPIILFLDEVQYDEKWGITLKSVYDRSRKVFLLATGSAALTMNTNADVARRTIYEKLYPLCFTEFLKIKNEKFEEKGLAKEMRKAIFDSNNAKNCLHSIKLLEPAINKYFFGADRMDIDKYVKYGSLPFMVALKNEALVYDQINKTLDRIINNDVARTGRFGNEIISKIPAILYAVADMDQINYTKISSVFGISRPKVAEIFDVLEKTETLIKIYPYGSHIAQSRKPLKYLFASPAFRSMYYHMIGNIVSAENASGKLLEDTVGMYLKRFLNGKANASLTYDSAQGGADFIVSFGAKRVLIEVGAGSKDCRQLVNTAAKVKADYGFAVCNDELELLEENILKMPLKYFLLI
jgi:predicted AAA+ superfamily ATPase